MMKPNGIISFEELLAKCNSGEVCDVFEPNPGPDDALTWRIRVRGRGVYMGRADKDESGNLLLADPHTFIPEMKSSVVEV
jgi:hypothetical protein